MSREEAVPGTDLQELVARGTKAADSGRTAAALECFERVVRLQSTPANWSYLAFCLARERRQFEHATRLCEEAVRREPHSSVLYLNLGKVHLLAGRKDDAIRTFRQGLLYERNALIESELRRLGLRKPPVLSFLAREHPVNKYLGIVLKKLKIR